VTNPDQPPVRLANLSPDQPQPVSFTPDAGTRGRIAARLGLGALRKFRFAGQLVPEGGGDWRLEARLGATVVQPCVVSLDPVTTRIDETVIRHYLRDMADQPDVAEAEMPEDETTEPLPDRLDIAEVAQEALALLLPTYPRAKGAALGEAVFTEPGHAPMRDKDSKPFAGLAKLRRQTDASGDDDPG